VKIIKRGEVPDLKPIRFECSHCTSVFEATRQEARRVSDQRDGDYWDVRCPVCTRQVTKAVHS
jgi:uncharacterized C2H2 Zn-finger protein